MDNREQMVSKLWVEKYRPKTLEEMVLPNHIENMCKKFVENNECSNLLLQSITPGTGKTTLSKVLCNELNAHSLYLNISEKRNLDTLRNDIQGFASGKNFAGRRRILILDEAEGMNPIAQAALRGMLEELSGNASFILTCNNVNNIIKPLREGRTFEISMDYHNKETIKELKPKIAKRLIKILKEEKVEYEPEAIKHLIENNFPSIRTMISLLHSYSLQFGKIDGGINSNLVINEQLIDLILAKKFNECRIFVKEHALDYPGVYKFLFENLPQKVDNSQRGNVVIAIAEADKTYSSNPEIHFARMLIEIFGLL